MVDILIVIKYYLTWNVYFQVADELVAEFSDPNNNLTSPDQVLLQF